jgi:hypothetical protein
LKIVYINKNAKKLCYRSPISDFSIWWIQRSNKNELFWLYNVACMDIFDLRLPVTTLISSSFKSLMVRIYVFELKKNWDQFSDGGSFLCFLHQKCFSTIVWARIWKFDLFLKIVYINKNAKKLCYRSPISDFSIWWIQRSNKNELFWKYLYSFRWRPLSVLSAQTIVLKHFWCKKQRKNSLSLSLSLARYAC